MGAAPKRGKLGATIHVRCHGDYIAGYSIPPMSVRQVLSRSLLTLPGRQEDGITFPAPSAYKGGVTRQLTISLISPAMKAVYMHKHAHRGAVVDKTQDQRLRGLRSAPGPVSYPKKHTKIYEVCHASQQIYPPRPPPPSGNRRQHAASARQLC